ncbi:cupin domain-containing protein [Hyphomicrobium sp.]|uniref:cupin domain-containing protein n=1 Tax=Hyphomicrobium sp. TaxID=82 RepID=UPI003F6F38F5
MIEHLRRSLLPLAAGMAAGAAGSFLLFAGTPDVPSIDAPSIRAVPAAPLLASSETVIGEPIIYPAGKGKVTAAVVTLAPGQATGWHTHAGPVVGYVLEGTLDVDYGDKGVHVYRTGEAMLEAIGFAHNGRNNGTVPMRILAVFIGAEGLPPSTPVAAPGKP